MKKEINRTNKARLDGLLFVGIMLLISLISAGVIWNTAAFAESDIYAVLNASSFSADNVSKTGDKAINITEKFDGGQAVTDFAKTENGELKMSSDAYSSSSAAFMSAPLAQTDGFSTAFKIGIINSVSNMADGWVFVAAAATNKVGVGGQGMGYSEIPRSVSVEYDMYDNKTDKSENWHLGLGKNGVAHNDKDGNDPRIGFSKPSGVTNHTVSGWIEYDAVNKKLYVRIAFNTDVRPSGPTVVYDIDLAQYTGPTYHIGFTFGTGWYKAAMSIKHWVVLNRYLAGGASFANSYIEDNTPPSVPEIAITDGILTVSGGEDDTGGSGLSQLQYMYGGEWTDYDGPVDISDIDTEDFPCAAGARSIDDAGNISQSGYVSVESGESGHSFTEGNGTKEHPYKVTQQNQVAHIAGHTGTDIFYELNADLNYAGYTIYTVNYDKGSNSDGNSRSAIKIAGCALNLSGRTFTKDGSVQTGWTETDGGIKNYELGGTYSADSDIILYPVLSSAYTITYNKGGNGTGEISSELKAADIDFTLSSSTFTRSGYTQTGWSTSSGGSTKDYELGGIYTANANLTLYPVWKIEGSVTVSINGWIYGGYSENTNAPVGTPNGGQTNPVITYKVKNANDSIYAATVPANAGNYTVRMVYGESATHAGATGTADFTISKASLAITANNISQVYGSAFSANGVIFSEFVNGETSADLGGMLAYDTTYTESTSAGASSVTLTPKGLTSNNYDISFYSGSVTIIRATAVPPNDAGSKVFSGSTQTSDITAGAGYAVKTNAGGTNPGEYDVVLELDSNYQWNENDIEDKTIKFTITKGSQNAPALSVSNAAPDSIILTQVLGAEYSRDGSVWQNSNVFTGLNANTEYTFYIRMKMTDNLNASDYTAGAVSTTPATQVIPQDGTHEISGEVTDANDDPVAGALVYIVMGRNFFGSAVTDSNGYFTLSNLPDGVYNVVALYGGKTATDAVTVNGGNANVTIRIHDLNVSSKLDVKEGAPNVVVDGLDRIAGADNFLTGEEKNALETGGGSAELKLTVEASNTQVSAEDGKTIGFIVDITVTKTILDSSGGILSQYNIPTLSGLISVIIPLGEAFTGKQNYVVYRMHGGEQQIITTSPNIDGEYFMLTGDGKFIIIYTKNFSVYAVGFDNGAIGGVTGGNCFVHWIMLALMLTYIAYALILIFVFGKKNHLSQYFGWGAYVLGVIITACFMKRDALCVTFFIFAVLIALAALAYWLVTFNSRVKNLVEIIKQKIRKQNKEEATAQKVTADRTGTHEECRLVDEESPDEDECAELLEFVEEEVLTETEIAEIIGAEEGGADESGIEADEITAAEEQVGISGEIVIDEETKQILAAAAVQRQAFIDAKKAGTAAVIPELRFTLSREDVLDYIVDTAQRAESFPVPSKVLQKSKKYYCDTLYCGQWCFGLMYERSGVIKFTLRMDVETAAGIEKNHTAFKSALFPNGEGWYDLIADSSFGGKNEVFGILDKCYDFVLKRYYIKENQNYSTDAAAAKVDAEAINTEVKANAKTLDLAFDLAIAEREDALLKYRAKNQLKFKMTRKRMLLYANSNKELTNGGGTVVERGKRYMPASLKFSGKTYALVYEKAYKEKADDGSETVKAYVSLTVRISDAYAEWLSLRHPEVCRARFPKNRNWYIVPVDGSFQSAQMAYRILKRAKKFITKN